MNMKQIEAFVKIANNRSFSRTAKEMYLTQPTVSAVIKNLEEELNMPLFVRSTREVELTEGGKQIFLYAQQMLDLSKAIVKISNDTSLRMMIGHEIVISASTIPAQYILPNLMSAFSSKYPETQFKVSVSDSANVIQDVEEHRAAIGLCGVVPSKKDMVCIPIYQDELLIVTPNTEKYRRRKQDPSIGWIKKTPVILREDGSGTKEEALRYLEKGGIGRKDLNVAASIGNTGAILQSVKKGIGITFISYLAAQEDLQEGRILAFPFPGQKCKRSINLIYRSSFPHTEAAKRFVRFVRNSCRFPAEEKGDPGLSGE